MPGPASVIPPSQGRRSIPAENRPRGPADSYRISPDFGGTVLTFVLTLPSRNRVFRFGDPYGNRTRVSKIAPGK